MKLKPPQVVVLSFLVAIVVGVALLSLPLAYREGRTITLVDRIFTATSATCVTGLVVCDTARDWSPFGQTVIFLLFQTGGLGIMTLSTFFAVLLGRKFTLHRDVVIHSALDHNRIYGGRRLIVSIIALTMAIEIVGALLLFLRWNYTQGWPVHEKLVKSLFHSVSAFCNAGFSLFSDSFESFQSDLYVNLVMIFLIFLGGLGFIVIFDVIRSVFSAREYRRPLLSLQSTIVLIVSVLLIVIGAVSILFLEGDNVLREMTYKDRVMGALFQAVTPRTAGFNTLPISRFTPATLIVLMLLMFIGASPGSTGGGIKTCTFAIVISAVWAMARNRDKVFMFGRTIPRSIVRRALVIFIVSLIWILCATFLFVACEGKNLGTENLVVRSLFEVTSAFGTVGLSTGITSHLSTLGKVIIVVTMFVGRVGPLTLALAVAISEEKIDYSYPEEKVMVG